jgi:hypothetical protein
MRWINRERVKVDRVACPWLIKRFVDSDAQSEFLAKYTDWSSVRDGGLFDVPGCELGHHGQDVSFDPGLNKHSWNDPALRLLAATMRAADPDPTNPHVADEGLRWIADGFSNLGLSDHNLLNRELILYDALPAECKERCTSHASN